MLLTHTICSVVSDGEYVILEVNVSPTFIAALLGLAVILCTLVSTTTVHLAESPFPVVAVIVAVPVPIAVTYPFPFTVTIPLLLLVQDTFVYTFALVGLTVAFNW